MGLIGYVRVSRIGSRAGEGYISPEIQRDAISAYARELGEEVAYFADDQDFSGGRLPVERRALIVPRGVEWEHLPPIAGVAGVEPGDERGETGLDR